MICRPAVMFDVATGQIARSLDETAPTSYDVVLDHDGSHLYRAGIRAGAQVIDLAQPTTAPIVLPGSTDQVAGLALWSDEKTLYGDGRVVEWEIDPQTWVRQACRIAPPSDLCPSAARHVSIPPRFRAPIRTPAFPQRCTIA